MYMEEILKEDGLTYEQAFADEDYKPIVEQWSLEHLGYIIRPENLFRELNRRIVKPHKTEVSIFEKGPVGVVPATRKAGAEIRPVHRLDTADDVGKIGRQDNFRRLFGFGAETNGLRSEPKGDGGEKKKQ